MYIHIYSCYARLISFEINLKTTDFKRNPSGITRIYEYTPPPPPPPINALATALRMSHMITMQNEVLYLQSIIIQIVCKNRQII